MASKEEKQAKADKEWQSVCDLSSVEQHECIECHAYTWTTWCIFEYDYDTVTSHRPLCAACLPAHYALHQLNEDQETMPEFYKNDLKWAKLAKKYGRL